MSATPLQIYAQQQQWRTQVVAYLSAIPLNVVVLGAAGDGVTNDTAAFAQALAAGGPIYIPPGIYLLNAGLIAAKANTSLIAAPGVTLTFPIVGTNASALSISANEFSIIGTPRLIGPAASVYVAGENGIAATGTSNAARLSGLYLDVDVSNFGSACVLAQWVDNIEISPRTYLHAGGYQGFVAISCDHGILPAGMRVKNIGPGTGGNMYGVQITHATATPPVFCRNWTISAQIEDSAWAGIDAHGCYNTLALGAKVFNCRYGVALTTSSNAFAGYAGYSNTIADCVIDSRKSDGSAGSYANLDSGIIVNGSGTPTTEHYRVIVTGNSIYGYGVLNTATAAIAAQYVRSLVLSGNIVEKWNGLALNVGGSDGIVADNLILDLASNGASSFETCISSNYSGSYHQSFTGNKHVPGAGFAAKEGLRFNAPSIRPVLVANDLGSATTPLILAPTNFFAGTDGAPLAVLSLGAGGGNTTLNLSAFAYGSPLIELELTAAAPITITDMTGVPIGTIVSLYVDPGSSTITFDRSHAVLRGSANWVGAPYATLTLRAVGTGGVNWAQVAGEDTNG